MTVAVIACDAKPRHLGVERRPTVFDLLTEHEIAELPIETRQCKVVHNREDCISIATHLVSCSCVHEHYDSDLPICFYHLAIWIEPEAQREELRCLKCAYHPERPHTCSLKVGVREI